MPEQGVFKQEEAENTPAPAAQRREISMSSERMFEMVSAKASAHEAPKDAWRLYFPLSCVALREDVHSPGQSLQTRNNLSPAIGSHFDQTFSWLPTCGFEEYTTIGLGICLPRAPDLSPTKSTPLSPTETTPVSDSVLYFRDPIRLTDNHRDCNSAATNDPGLVLLVSSYELERLFWYFERILVFNMALTAWLRVAADLLQQIIIPGCDGYVAIQVF